MAFGRLFSYSKVIANTQPDNDKNMCVKNSFNKIKSIAEYYFGNALFRLVVFS